MTISFVVCDEIKKRNNETPINDVNNYLFMIYYVFKIIDN